MIRAIAIGHSNPIPQVHGKTLKNSGAFSVHDKEFLMGELKRHFDRERMFAIAPRAQGELSAAAKALVKTELMDDLKFKESPSSESAPGPNPLAVAYFERMLPQWHGEDTRLVALKDVLSDFNHEHEGLYRRACVVPFMRPFIDTGAVELSGVSELLIHVGRVAAQLEK